MDTAGSKEDILGRLKSHCALKVIINVAETFLYFLLAGENLYLDPSKFLKNPKYLRIPMLFVFLSA